MLLFWPAVVHHRDERSYVCRVYGYHAAGWCISVQNDAFHTCHQQLISNIWPGDVHVCACVCMWVWQYDSLTTPGLPCQGNWNWSMPITLLVSFLFCMWSVSEKTWLSQDEPFLALTRTVEFMCHCVCISETFFSVPAFCLQVFLGASCSYFSIGTSVEYITVTLDSFKVWHYPQSWVPAPLFSLLFREPVISQTLKEMTISKGGGWKSEKFLNTAVLAQPQLYH